MIFLLVNKKLLQITKFTEMFTCCLFWHITYIWSIEYIIEEQDSVPYCLIVQIIKMSISYC